ncbi:MAG: three component ABC system middle component [Caulobacteraceae bacterium]
MRPALPAWEQRSADYGNLFNPAFLMLVLAAACKGFESEQKGISDERQLGMPFVLFFLAVPLALSREFNDERPRRLAGSLVSWLRKNPAATANISAAAYSLVPVVREGIVFALRTGHLQAGDDGRFRSGRTHGELQLDVRTDLLAHLNNAGFAGRWLAKSGTLAPILEAFGLRP